jgi:hypothetical protein
MIYPVKLEFKIYPSGAWEDWSMYLSEPPSINRKVESENAGEAGLIVFDNASVSLYYDEGSSVYAAFQETQLISAQRYLFRISLPKSDKTYVQVFEGMADFSTIEWPDKSRLISFEVIDKLSAISLVGSGGARERTVDVWERCGSYDPAAYQIAISRGGAVGNYRRFYVDIIDRGYPEYSDCSEGAFLPGEVIEYNGEYCQIVSFQLVSTGAGIDPYDGHPTYYYGRGVITALHTAAFPEIPDVPSGFKIYANLFAGRNINVIENGSLISFDAFEIIAGMMNLAWEGTQVINRVGDDSFKIPIEYFAQLMSGSLFNKQPLDALKMLADSMQAYIFFDKNGSLVIQKKKSLAVNETTCAFGNTRVISASKKYFWDKLVDGVTITMQGWTLKNGEALVGKSALAKTNPETGELVKPKNELSKDVLGGDPGLTTQEALDAAAVQIASAYMSFYGSRHNCREYELDLDDNTLSWDLLDNILIETEKFFFESINIDPAESKASVKLVGVQEHNYDLRQVVVGLSNQAYTSSSTGGSYSSGGASYTGNPYLWDGNAIGLDAAKARLNLGLQDISNIGTGEVSTEEFNYLNGVTSNIQTQLNSKENILSFTDPLLRSGSQISITRGSFNLGANSNGFTFSGSGKPVGGDIALNFPQRLDAGGIPQFNGVYAGFADLADNLLMSGAALADSERNIYAGRIGIGGDPDFTNYIFKAYGNGYFTGNILVDGDIYIGGRINQVNVTDLYVVDKNIILNRGGDNTTAANAGIKIEGASASVLATLLYDGTSWTHSHDINTAGGKGYKVNNSFAIDSSRNFFGANATLSGLIDQNGAGVNTFAGDISSDSYLSGYFGMGFKFWRDTNGANGELDNLVIRNSLRTHIFQKDIVRATNGYLFISDASEIAANTSTSDGTKLIYCKENVFQVGDLLWYKDVDDAGGAITGIKITITEVNGEYTLAQSGKKTYRYTYTVYSGSGTFKAGGTIVRIGSSVAGRQGSIYFDASSPASPFMDIYDGVASHTDFQSFDKLVYRSGNLSGITDPALGALSGYGVYTRRGFFTEDVVIGGRSLGLMQGLTALFHFDDNDYDSISGIKPNYTGTKNETAFGLVNSSDNSLVYTKVNGKFGGGIAIEDGTTNLITNGGFEAGGSTGYSWWGSGTRSIVGGYHGNGYYMESTASAVGLSSSAIAAVSGTTYTIQVKVKGDHLNYFYILKASGNVNISALAAKTYLEGGWYQLAYTVTCSVTETWNILFAFYNNAKGVIDEAQVEARPYASSFVESSRPIGTIEYNVPYLSDFTIAYYLPYEYKPYNSIRNFLEAYSPEGYSILIRNGYNNDFQIEGSNVSGTYASGWSVMTGLPYTNPGSNWNNALVVIRKTGPTVKAGIYYNGVFYERAEYTNAGLNFLINRIKIARGTGTGRLVIDELMTFNRSLSNDEIKRIYFSNQPLQESPGMTYISGNKIRTGMMYSENYVPGVSGSMWNLNTGYLETNDGWFRGAITASSGLIGGWEITSNYINKNYNNGAVDPDGYIIRLTTDMNNSGNNRPGFQAFWSEEGYYANQGRNSITLGAASYLYSTIGQFTTNGWDYEGGGLAINVNGKAVLMAGRRGSNYGASIAGWNFDNEAIYTGTKGANGAYTSSGMTIGSAGFISSPNTYITSSGVLYTKSANIAGWTIDSSAIYSGTRGANGAYTSSGMTIGSAGFISSPNTFISSSGVLYSKSGNIAGYSFDSGKFYVSTDFVLDAVNKKWYFANKSTYAATTAGIFMGLDAGVYKVNIGGPTSNIKWTGTALEINGGSLTSANITGATITGGTVQTAASGERIVLEKINEVSGHLAFYNAADVLCGIINSSGTLGGTYMLYIATGGHSFQGSINTDGDMQVGQTGRYRYAGGRSVPIFILSDTTPNSPEFGDIWYNYSTNILKIYTNEGWKTITTT